MLTKLYECPSWSEPWMFACNSNKVRFSCYKTYIIETMRRLAALMCIIVIIVISEIFVRILFLRNFTYAKFCENRTIANGQITLSFTDIGKSCPSSQYLTLQICLKTLFVKKYSLCHRQFTFSLEWLNVQYDLRERSQL